MIEDQKYLLGSRKINGVKMLLAHFSNNELGALSVLQMSTAEDPVTGLREYSKLAKLLKNPSFKRELAKAMLPVLEEKQAEKIENKNVKNEIGFLKDKFPNAFSDTEAEKDEYFLRELEKMGIAGDNRIAYVPFDFIKFLVEIGFNIEINPNTGLFSFFLPVLGAIAGGLGAAFLNKSKAGKGIIRAAATVAGSMFGGPIGAAAGNALATAVTGGNRHEILRGGLTAGATSFASPYLASATGMSAPMATGFTRAGIGALTGESLGEAAGQGLMHGATHHIGSKFMPGMGGKSSAPPGSSQALQQVMSKDNLLRVPVSEAGIIKTGSMGAKNLSALNPSASSLGLSNLLQSGKDALSSFGIEPGHLTVAALSALNTHRAGKDDYKHYERRRKETAARENQIREDMGFNRVWKPTEEKKRRLNPHRHLSEWERRTGAYSNPYEEEYKKGGLVKNNLRSFSEGTLVKGPGKGQDDLIKTQVPENSYIIDASTTSMLGDGSTDAGSKSLKRFEQDIKKRAGAKNISLAFNAMKQSAKQLPVYLSDSEYKMDPLTVTLLGNGSNEEGSKILKRMVENIRKQKSMKGSGLPPKAKSPWAYL